VECGGSASRSCQIWSPYRYGHNNLLRFIDHDGILGSTHTDKEGNVVAVYDDKDLGVCKHDKNETEVLLLKLK